MRTTIILSIDVETADHAELFDLMLNLGAIEGVHPTIHGTVPADDSFAVVYAGVAIGGRK